MNKKTDIIYDLTVVNSRRLQQGLGWLAFFVTINVTGEKLAYFLEGNWFERVSDVNCPKTKNGCFAVYTFKT